MKIRIRIIVIATLMLLSTGCTTSFSNQNVDYIEIENAKIFDIKGNHFLTYLDYDITQASIILDDANVSYMDIALLETETSEEWSLGYSKSNGKFLIEKAEEEVLNFGKTDIKLKAFLDKLLIANNFFLDEFNEKHFVFEFNGARKSSSFSNSDNVYIINTNNELLPYGKSDISNAYVLTLFANEDVYFICFE